MPLLEQLFERFSRWSIESNEISDLFSNYKPKYDDDVIECLQFGICSSSDDEPPKEIAYFHF